MTINRYVSKTGSNTAPYLTWQTAATTIQDAINIALTDDTIWIRAGTYAENITIRRYLMVRSETGIPTDVIIDGGLTDRTVFMEDSTPWLIGVTVANGKMVAPGSGGDGAGIRNGNAANCIITDCETTGNEGGGVGYCILYNCLIINNSCTSRAGGAGYCTLYNCTIVKNTGSGGISGTYGCYLWNCISHLNTPGDDNGTFYYSCGPSYAGVGCLDSATFPPQFVSLTDYHLQEASPCINAGFNYDWMSDQNDPYDRNKDLDGNPRLYNSVVDMGAYESQWVESSSQSISSPSSSSSSSPSSSSISSSSLSSVSSSTQRLSSSSSLSSSTEEYVKISEKLVFAGNNGIVEGYMDKDRWKRINYEGSNNSGMVLESKKPFLWLYNDLLHQLSQVWADSGTETGNKISNIPSCKTLFINPFSGNTHILSNKEKTTDGDYIYGGDLIYYSYFDKVSANLSITYNKSIYDLFGAMDMVVDHIRNKIWVCDTLNHKIIAVNSTNNEIEYVFSSEDYVFPLSLVIDVSSGTVFARAYVSQTLEEVILIIKNNSIFSIFKSPGIIGLKDIYMIDNCLVVLDKNLPQSCVYRIDLDDGSIWQTYGCENQNIDLLSGECLNNSIITYSGGIAKLILTNGNDLGEINVNLDNRFRFIPSIFDSSYWGYVYRSDGKHNLVNIKAVGSDKILVSNGNATFDLPVGGSIIVGERKPVILVNSGNRIIKLSNNGDLVEKTKNLVVSYDTIDTHIADNAIVIGKKDGNYFKTLDYLFAQEQDYNMASNITDISVVQNDSCCYWILCEGNNLFKVNCLNGILTIKSNIHIVSLDTLVGVKHNFENNGAIVFSSSSIFKISESGSSLVWKNENFTQITDIFVNQDISTIYSAQFHYNSLTTKSMAFDSFRNKMWWISN